MQVRLLKNIGFCKGVENALKNLDEIIKDNKNSNLICFGNIVHNEIVLKQHEDKGVKFIKLNRDNVAKLSKDDVVIYSAHGHDEKITNSISNKSYDLICPKLLSVHNFFKSHLDDQIVFIGEKEHDEVVAILSLSNNVHLYDINDKIDYSKLDKSKHTYITNQSTLSISNLHDIYEELRQNLDNIEIMEEICNVCRIRQEEIINLDEESYDTLIIVSSHNSANGNRLLYLANLYHSSKNNILVDSLEELKEKEIKGRIVVGSSTSTPYSIVEEIYNYISTKKDL